MLAISGCIILVIIVFFILDLDKITKPLIIKDNEILDTNTDELNTILNTAEDVVPKNVKEHNPLFKVGAHPDDYVGKNHVGGDEYTKFVITPIEENMQLYDSLSPKNTNQTTVVIVPIFTLLAYSNGGFYDYYEGKCNEECLTVDVISAYPTLKFSYTSSANANQVFQILGYDRIADYDVDRDPSILAKYDKVILLHNEYVTKKMFDVITNHPKVIYLYPNALFAEISSDEENNSITLIRGHGYPEKNITNGFNWKHDNTYPYEFDSQCKNWVFNKIDNGYMLNCYPENIIFHDIKLLETIRDL